VPVFPLGLRLKRESTRGRTGKAEIASLFRKLKKENHHENESEQGVVNLRWADAERGRGIRTRGVECERPLHVPNHERELSAGKYAIFKFVRDASSIMKRVDSE
jgi:hypothetical protein